MKITALLTFALLLGCSKQESAKDNLSESGTRSTALMSDKAQLPEIYAILRDFPRESLSPDTAFVMVKKQGDGSFSFVSTNAQWVTKDSDTLETTHEQGENAFIRIERVNARSFIEGYIGCDLYFPGVASLRHFYSITPPSSFRLVLLLCNAATHEHIVETDTFYFSNGPNAETNSVLVQSEIRFPQDTSMMTFQNKLCQYEKLYKGVCKQVEVFCQASNSVTQAKGQLR